jgi:hypothetical protein
MVTMEIIAMLLIRINLFINDSAANHMRISVSQNVGEQVVTCLCTFGKIERICRAEVAMSNL